MKHHHHSIGWREANNMQRGAARHEAIGVFIIYAWVVCVVAIVVDQLAR